MRGELANYELWIGHKLQACASGGKDWAKDRDSYLYLTKEEMDKKVKNGEIHIYTSTLWTNSDYCPKKIKWKIK